MRTQRRQLSNGLVATCGRCGVTQTVIMPVDEFRCETCAVAEVDEAATEQTRGGVAFLAIGAILIVIAVLMGRAGWNPLEGTDPEDTGVLPYVVIAGLGCLGLAFGAMRFRPNLRR